MWRWWDNPATFALFQAYCAVWGVNAILSEDGIDMGAVCGLSEEAAVMLPEMFEKLLLTVNVLADRMEYEQ